MMAATLANDGVNPVTGVSVFDSHYVRDVLSVMNSCGMYNYAGQWSYEVGMPAKSGVSGGIMAVIPGQVGIGVYSPPLDAQGNSVRGIKVCQDISNEFDLHAFNNRTNVRSVIRRIYHGDRVRSSRNATRSMPKASRLPSSRRKGRCSSARPRGCSAASPSSAKPPATSSSTSSACTSPTARPAS